MPRYRIYIAESLINIHEVEAPNDNEDTLSEMLGDLSAPQEIEQIEYYIQKTELIEEDE